jgi:hypothetical protein
MMHLLWRALTAQHRAKSNEYRNEAVRSQATSALSDLERSLGGQDRQSDKTDAATVD